MGAIPIDSVEVATIVLALAGELFERLLFFRAEASRAMPGVG